VVRLLAAIGIGLTLAAPSVSLGATAKARPRVTVIGDSVASVLRSNPDATRKLAQSLDLQLDLRVCRKLVEPSCWYEGEQAPTALQAIQAAGSSLGRVVIVDVGYNDIASEYRPELDQVMQALVDAGVSRVVWVTLHVDRENYGLINGVIANAPSRWPQLSVADWNAFSAGKPWFGYDGLHLNDSGALGLARLLRMQVMAALGVQAPRVH
jgi:hypothetical protein